VHVYPYSILHFSSQPSHGVVFESSHSQKPKFFPSPQISQHSEGRARLPLEHSKPTSIVQVVEQPSPLILGGAAPTPSLVKSSHSSGGSSQPFPQALFAAAMVQTERVFTPVSTHVKPNSTAQYDEQPSPDCTLPSSQA